MVEFHFEKLFGRYNTRSYASHSLLHAAGLLRGRLRGALQRMTVSGSALLRSRGPLPEFHTEYFANALLVATVSRKTFSGKRSQPSLRSNLQSAGIRLSGKSQVFFSSPYNNSILTKLFGSTERLQKSVSSRRPHGSRSAEHADHVFPVLQVREDSEAISEENECINEYVFTT